MAYVRRRTTKAGAISTALVEAYRDGQGRPRQRQLANLHGELTPLKALAKLAAQREALRKESKALVAEAEAANRFTRSSRKTFCTGFRTAPSSEKR